MEGSRQLGYSVQGVGDEPDGYKDNEGHCFLIAVVDTPAEKGKDEQESAGGRREAQQEHSRSKVKHVTRGRSRSQT